MGRMSERGEALSVRERERLLLLGDHLIVLGFYLLLLILSLRKLRGFILYGFLKENYLCLLAPVLCLFFIDVLVILLVKYPKIIMLA